MVGHKKIKLYLIIQPVGKCLYWIFYKAELFASDGVATIGCDGQLWPLQ